MYVAHSTQVRDSVIEDLNIATINLMEENISQQTKQKLIIFVKYKNECYIDVI